MGSRVRRRFLFAAVAVTAIGVGGSQLAPVSALDVAAPAQSPVCRLWNAAVGDTVNIDSEFSVAVTELNKSGQDCETGTVAITNAYVAFGQSGLIGNNVDLSTTGTALSLSDGVFEVPDRLAATAFEIDPNINGGVITASTADGDIVKFVEGQLRPTDRKPIVDAGVEPKPNVIDPNTPVYPNPEAVPGANATTTTTVAGATTTTAPGSLTSNCVVSRVGDGVKVSWDNLGDWPTSVIQNPSGTKNWVSGTSVSYPSATTSYTVTVWVDHVAHRSTCNTPTAATTTVVPTTVAPTTAAPTTVLPTTTAPTTTTAPGSLTSNCVVARVGDGVKVSWNNLGDWPTSVIQNPSGTKNWVSGTSVSYPSAATSYTVTVWVDHVAYRSTCNTPAAGQVANAAGPREPVLNAKLISSLTPLVGSNRAQQVPNVQPGDLLPGFLAALLTGKITMSLELRDSGVYVSIKALNQLWVRGIIHWNGSYVLTVTLSDLKIDDPAMGNAVINATGTISGASLDVDPIVDITGTLTGTLKLGPTITVTGATIRITNSGLELNGNANLACTSGSLTIGINAQYTNDKNWNVGITGGSAAACEVQPGLVLTNTNVNGSIKNVAGVISGNLTFASTAGIAAMPEGFRDWTIGLDTTIAQNAAGAVTLGGTVSLTSPSASFTGTIGHDGSLNLTGNAKVQGPNGEVTVSGTITGTLGSPNVSLSGAFRAGFASETVTVAAVGATLALRDLTDDAGVVASQSKTNGTFVAALGIDNNPATYESVASNGTNGWFEVDLGAERYVDTVVITPKDGTLSLNSAVVQGSLTRSTATAFGTEYSKVARSYQLPASVTAAQTVIVRARVRYLRVWGRAANINPEIAELVANGANVDAPIPTNWAAQTGAVVAGSGVASQATQLPLIKNQVSNAGGISSAWTAGTAPLAWMGVDLGADRFISTVDIYGTVGHAWTPNMAKASLVVSAQPITGLTTMAAIKGRADATVYPLTAALDNTVQVNRTARYVAVVKPDGVAVGIIMSDINVMGYASPAAAKGNLARLATTKVTSSGAVSGFEAGNAADGFTHPKFSQRAGFESADGAGSAFLEFDAGSTQFLDSIRLYGRTPELRSVTSNCTPNGTDPVSGKPFTNCVYFPYTGAASSFVAPGAGNYSVKLWGAAGGSGYGWSVYGGHGGFTKGTVSLSANQAIEVGVGQGGAHGPNGTKPTFGGGGYSKGASYASSGGGMSWLKTGTDYLLVAGGGGGAAGSSNGDGGSGGGLEGVGGGTTTGTLSAAWNAALCAPVGGKGGTQTAGGATGSGGLNGTAGSLGQGGLGALRGALGDSAGGGGGYYGGGGGGGFANTQAQCDDAAGGGGSGYIAPSVVNGAFESKPVRAADKGAINTPPASTDAHYALSADVAKGKTGNTVSGGNGLVVVQWPDLTPPASSFDSLVVLVSEQPFVSSDTASAMAQPGVTAYPVAALNSPALLQINRLGRYVRIVSNKPAALDKVELAEAEIWGASAAVLDGTVVVDRNGIGIRATLTAPCPGGTGLLTFNVAASGTNLNNLAVDVAGAISGGCSINGVAINDAQLTGRLTLTNGKVGFTGNVALVVNGATINAGITIGDTGVSISGTVVAPCATGSLTLDLAAAFNGNGGANGGIVGTVGPTGCVLTPGISLGAGTPIRGTISTDANKNLVLDLTADVVLNAPWLPADASAWTAKISMVNGPNGLTTKVTLTSNAGSFTGTINPDGTFTLDGQILLDMSGTKVSVEAHIVKSTPNGEPVVHIGGAIDATVNGVQIKGTLVVDGNTATLRGSAIIPCNPGSITFALDGTIPLQGDWSMNVTGVIATGGCRLNPDVLLASGTIGGKIGMKAGQLVVDLTGDVNFQTRPGLIPAGTNYNGKFSISTVGNHLVGSVSLTGNGLKIGGTIDFKDQMNWTITGAGFVTIKGHRIDFNAVVKMVKGRAVYTASGSIQGPIQLADNVWLMSGSATISGSGNNFTASFNGVVRVACSSGDLWANANGTISSNENWSVNFSVTGNGCRFGNNLYLDGNVASGSLTSSNGRVNGTIDAYVSWWKPAGGVTISNIRLHLQIIDGFRFVGSVSADAEVKFTLVILFIPCEKRLAAHVDIQFDINARGTGNVRVGISNIQINWLSLPFQVSLELQLRNGSISGLSIGF